MPIFIKIFSLAKAGTGLFPKLGAGLMGLIKTGGPKALTGLTVASMLTQFAPDATEDEKAQVLGELGIGPNDAIKAEDVNRGFLDTVDSAFFGLVPDAWLDKWFGETREQVAQKNRDKVQDGQLALINACLDDLRIVGRGLGVDLGSAAIFVTAMQRLQATDDQILKGTVELAGRGLR